MGIGLGDGLEGRGGDTGVDHTHCYTLAGFGSLCPNPRPLGHQTHTNYLPELGCPTSTSRSLPVLSSRRSSSTLALPFTPPSALWKLSGEQLQTTVFLIWTQEKPKDKVLEALTQAAEAGIVWHGGWSVPRAWCSTVVCVCARACVSMCMCVVFPEDVPLWSLHSLLIVPCLIKFPSGPATGVPLPVPGDSYNVKFYGN